MRESSKNNGVKHPENGGKRQKQQKYVDFESFLVLKKNSIEVSLFGPSKNNPKKSFKDLKQ